MRRAGLVPAWLLVGPGVASSGALWRTEAAPHLWGEGRAQPVCPGPRSCHRRAGHPHTPTPGCPDPRTEVAECTAGPLCTRHVLPPPLCTALPQQPWLPGGSARGPISRRPSPGDGARGAGRPGPERRLRSRAGAGLQVAAGRWCSTCLVGTGGVRGWLALPPGPAVPRLGGDHPPPRAPVAEFCKRGREQA